VKADIKSVGRCLSFSEAVAETVEKLPYIECTLEHTHEIYAVKTYEKTDIYPGFDELERQARLACLTAFEPYVERSAFDSTLFYSWLVPTLDGWNDNKVEDRTTLCVLGRSDGGTLTKSMKGENI